MDRRSYYTLYFSAHFDQPFASTGAWHDDSVKPGDTSSSGGTTYGTAGYPPKGKGSGVWVAFDPAKSSQVGVRVGISYVSIENAEANLRAENPDKSKFEEISALAHRTWNAALSRIRIAGGTRDQQAVFYTALYHSLLHMNLFSDVNGEYHGMDGQTHKIDRAHQRDQFANFSGWDVYRSQLQLVALIDPLIASDMAQSLLNQATQLDGEWDRWTHNTGETHVMSGDPSAPAARRYPGLRRRPLRPQERLRLSPESRHRSHPARPQQCRMRRCLRGSAPFPRSVAEAPLHRRQIQFLGRRRRNPGRCHRRFRHV